MEKHISCHKRRTVVENPLRKLKALNPETELWWDTSPLLWPNFRNDFAAGLGNGDKDWFLKETESMFLGAPTDQWVFSGCTTNPPLSWNVLKGRKEEWDKVIAEKKKTYTGRSKYGLYRMVYAEVVKRGAEKFMPLFEASNGKYGHLSGQVEPGLIRNTPGMIEMAEELAELSPNIMIKVPCSTQGVPVFKHLASKGIATNATLCYTLPQIMAVANNVGEGRKLHLAESGTPRHGWRAVCTHMSGRFEDSAALRGYLNKHNLHINPLELRVASEAVVKKAAGLFVERDLPIKMLDCSHRIHPAADGGHYYPQIDMFAGGPIVYTIPTKVVGNYMMWYRDREITNGWDKPVSEDVLGKLLDIPWFKSSYEEDGQGVDQFSELPMLLETEAEFGRATNEMIEYVGSFL